MEIMTGVDRILALLAFVGFVVFSGIVVWWVREIDLIIVVVLVSVMAGYDFWLGAGQAKSDDAE